MCGVRCLNNVLWLLNVLCRDQSRFGKLGQVLHDLWPVVREGEIDLWINSADRFLAGVDEDVVFDGSVLWCNDIVLPSIANGNDIL